MAARILGISGSPVPESNTDRTVKRILQQTGLDAQNRSEHPHFRAWLVGMIGWIQMVHPQQGSRLQSELAELQ